MRAQHRAGIQTTGLSLTASGHATPHAIPNKTGHLYYFLRSVWPKMGHRELLLAPEWWSRRLNKNNDAAIFGRDRRPPAAAAAGEKGKGGKMRTKSYKFSAGKK